MLKRYMGYKRLLALAAISGGAAPVERTATGNPLTFGTDLARPLKSLLIPFTPVQSGTGDPSPQNIRSILPWNGLTVYGGGKNLLDFSVPEANPDNTGAGDSNKRIFTPYTFCKGITANNYFDKEKVDSYNIQGNTLTVENNTVGYGIGFALPLNANKYYSIRCEGENFRANVGYYAKDGSFISTTNSILYEGTRPEYQFSPPNDAYIAVIVFVCKTVGSPAIFRNVQIEVGQTATAYEPYHPITETDISFPSPVYGGEHEAVSGRLMNEWAEIASYNGETLPGEWLSDRDVYQAGTTPTIGAQVVYKLATPQEITLTPEQITAIVGDNTIWSDANGSMTAVFLKKG